MMILSQNMAVLDCVPYFPPEKKPKKERNEKTKPTHLDFFNATMVLNIVHKTNSVYSVIDS